MFILVPVKDSLSDVRCEVLMPAEYAERLLFAKGKGSVGCAILALTASILLLLNMTIKARWFWRLLRIDAGIGSPECLNLT